MLTSFQEQEVGGAAVKDPPLARSDWLPGVTVTSGAEKNALALNASSKKKKKKKENSGFCGRSLKASRGVGGVKFGSQAASGDENKQTNKQTRSSSLHRLYTGNMWIVIAVKPPRLGE